MLSKSLKLSAVALSTTFVMACVPDPWQGTLQFGESRQSELKGVHQLSSGDILSITNNGVLYRITNAGEILWSAELPVEGSDTRRMVVDSNEDAYLIAEYREDDGSDLRASMILKFNGEGNTIWTRYFSCANGNVSATDIEIGPNNTMYAQFGADCENFLSTARQGDMDNVILKMDSGTGDVFWTRRDGAPGEYLDSLAGSLVFSKSGELISISTMLSDILMARIQTISTDGELLNEISIEEQIVPFGKAAVDAEGNLYLSGITLGNVFFDQPPIGSGDTGLLKLDPEFDVLWARVIGTGSNDTSMTGVVLDDSGNLYLGGRTYGALPSNQNQGQDDAFVSKWSTDGLHQWSVQIGTESYDSTEAIAVSREGGVFMVGGVSGELVPDAEISERLFISKLTPDGTIISKQPAQ